MARAVDFGWRRWIRVAGQAVFRRTGGGPDEDGVPRGGSAIRPGRRGRPGRGWGSGVLSGSASSLAGVFCPACTGGCKSPGGTAASWRDYAPVTAPPSTMSTAPAPAAALPGCGAGRSGDRCFETGAIVWSVLLLSCGGLHRFRQFRNRFAGLEPAQARHALIPGRRFRPLRAATAPGGFRAEALARLGQAGSRTAGKVLTGGAGSCRWVRASDARAMGSGLWGSSRVGAAMPAVSGVILGLASAMVLSTGRDLGNGLNRSKLAIPPP